MMRDEQLQNVLARLMLGGVMLAAVIIVGGFAWYLSAHWDTVPGGHVFSGEPSYLVDPIEMGRQALAVGMVGERRSVVMIGVLLLLLNPLARVAMAAFGFLAQRDRLYAGISLLVLGVLLFSFLW
jgi:uncharacterized membrane protein